MKPPKAIVKSPRLIKHGGLPSKLREGRGFSILELKEAGLTINQARRLGLYVDKRRRSKHPWNVEALKKFLESTRRGEDC